MSNDALAKHDYTGMWKLTLLCAFVQLFGTLHCSLLHYTALRYSALHCIPRLSIGRILTQIFFAGCCISSPILHYHILSYLILSYLPSLFSGLFFINLLPSGVKEQVNSPSSSLPFSLLFLFLYLLFLTDSLICHLLPVLSCPAVFYPLLPHHLLSCPALSRHVPPFLPLNTSTKSSPNNILFTEPLILYLYFQPTHPTPPTHSG